MEKNSRARSRSRAAAWIVAILAVLFTLYLVTYPYFWQKKVMQGPSPKSFFDHYGKPYDWVHDHTPLKRPLDACFDWWKPVTGYQSSPFIIY